MIYYHYRSIMRDLTSEEAKIVDAKAKKERPYYFNSETDELIQISAEFEIWLILTPAGLRTRLANYFQFVLNNDINDWSTRQELLEEWMEDEIDDLRNEIEAYGEIANTYDELKTGLSEYLPGFEDIDEVNKLSTDLTTSIGTTIDRKNSLQFEKAVNTVLLAKSEGSGVPDNVIQEIKSWVRLLLTYD